MLFVEVTNKLLTKTTFLMFSASCNKVFTEDGCARIIIIS